MTDIISPAAYKAMMERDRNLAARIRRRKMAKTGRVRGSFDRSYEGYLLRTYGLSLQDAKLLWEAQERRCPCCGHDLPEPSSSVCRTVHVDHCHKTGKVRGLLCVRCNIAIGQVRDSVETLRRMIAYLERG